MIAPDKKAAADERLNHLLKDLAAVIYKVTGLGSTIGQVAGLLEHTDVGDGVLCPELAIEALAKSVYTAGDQAYDIIVKIEEHLEGGAS